MTFSFNLSKKLKFSDICNEQNETLFSSIIIIFRSDLIFDILLTHMIINIDIVKTIYSSALFIYQTVNAFVFSK